MSLTCLPSRDGPRATTRRPLRRRPLAAVRRLRILSARVVATVFLLTLLRGSHSCVYNAKRWTPPSRPRKLTHLLADHSTRLHDSPQLFKAHAVDKSCAAHLLVQVTLLLRKFLRVVKPDHLINPTRPIFYCCTCFAFERTVSKDGISQTRRKLMIKGPQCQLRRIWSTNKSTC